jgi:hypothetical protein
MTTIGMGNDNQIVPLTFALVESENTESWLWFSRHIKIAIIQPNVCVLHDRHASILNAIKTLQQSMAEEEIGLAEPVVHATYWCQHFLAV